MIKEIALEIIMGDFNAIEGKVHATDTTCGNYGFETRNDLKHAGPWKTMYTLERRFDNTRQSEMARKCDQPKFKVLSRSLLAIL